MRVIITEIRRNPRSNRRFVFDLDDGKYPICYRSRVSSGAFFHSTKQRNWKGGKELNDYELMYHFQHVDDFYQTIEIFKKSLGKEPPPEYTTLIELPNLWEFYKEIGWDYKTKKWSK